MSGPQAIAFEAAAIGAGNQNGVDPNVLVGMAGQELTFNPAAQSSTSTANGLFGLTDGVRSQYGLSNGDATGTSASAITNQVTTAAHYLGDLKNGPVPKSHPEHSLEIAIGYYRGSRKGVNGAINSKGGYDAMRKLSYGGETLGHYINSVERYVP
ncbi:transglycosylase SLT domain-containing protein [Acidicapsa ligni]|uniref:transglycosylase SLT domain-containing protein n=1 Tax=Acidicapsa ligni TaxID=542300 RepID=UPI0021DFB015|nr:transglycosylase SLT domain-containing protein [Acidicapsa ligni]